MSHSENYLQVLAESLDKKIVILKEIQDLTDEQKQILDESEFNEDSFNDNVVRKGALIDELEKLDTGFQILYNNIKNQLENNREQYRTQILNLQDKIKTITDYSSSIQVAEQRNNNLVRNRFGSLHKEIHKSKVNRQVASNYYKSMNNISSQAYFMDSKK